MIRVSDKSEFVVHLAEFGTIKQSDFQILQSGIDKVVCNMNKYDLGLSAEEKVVFAKASGIVSEAFRQINMWNGLEGAKSKVQKFKDLGLFTQAEGLEKMIFIYQEFYEDRRND